MKKKKYVFKKLDGDKFHNDEQRTYYRIADANWGMYHPDDFASLKAAKKTLKTLHDKYCTEDSEENFWKGRKQVILKITETIKVLTK